MKCPTCNDNGVLAELSGNDPYRCPNGHMIRVGKATAEACYAVLKGMPPSRWTKSDQEFVAAYEALTRKSS